MATIGAQPLGNAGRQSKPDLAARQRNAQRAQQVRCGGRRGQRQCHHHPVARLRSGCSKPGAAIDFDADWIDNVGKVGSGQTAARGRGDAPACGLRHRRFQNRHPAGRAKRIAGRQQQAELDQAERRNDQDRQAKQGLKKPQCRTGMTSRSARWQTRR